MKLYHVFIAFAIALAAIWVANNVDFVGNIVGQG